MCLEDDMCFGHVEFVIKGRITVVTCHDATKPQSLYRFDVRSMTSWNYSPFDGVSDTCRSASKARSCGYTGIVAVHAVARLCFSARGRRRESTHTRNEHQDAPLVEDVRQYIKLHLI